MQALPSVSIWEVSKVSSLIYLDHAATTFPKPAAVLREVQDCMRYRGGNPGRSSHTLALSAASDLYACREAAADFFGLSTHPERVVFTMNTTHALNIVLKGLLRQGDHAVCSDMEHNAVYRPLYRMQKEGRITFDTFNTLVDRPDRTPAMIVDSLRKAIQPNTRLVVVSHASNICSASLPLWEIGHFCRRRGVLFVVDAAQSAGHLPIDMNGMCIDALCVPGHKGLYGPQGCGMLLLGERLSPADLPDTLTEGGNGVDSLEGDMTLVLPERHESGTPPTPAISGLLQGIRFVQAIGVDRIREHEESLYCYARDRLSRIPRIRMAVPFHVGSVLLFNVDGYTSDEVAAELDRHDICVRAGFHCAALGHRTLRTPPTGAVRASFGWFNTPRDVDALVKCVGGL